MDSEKKPISIEDLPLMKVYEPIPGPLILGYKTIVKKGKIRISCPNLPFIPKN